MTEKFIDAKSFEIVPTNDGRITLRAQSKTGNIGSIVLDKEAFELLTLAIFQTLLTVPETHPFFELRQLLSVTSLTASCLDRHTLTISPSLGIGVELHSTIEYEQVLELRNQIDAALLQYQKPAVQ